MIGSVEEFARLCASPLEQDYLRAIGDQAPTIVWEEILRARPDLAEIVATSATVPHSILEIVASRGNWRARYTVATSVRTPGHVLARLASDEDTRVRQAVVANESTPLKLLAALREDPVQDVADMAKLAWQERAERRSGRHSSKADPVWDVEEPKSVPIPIDSHIGRYDSFFERLCAERGLTGEHVIRGFDPRDKALPSPRCGPWVIAPWDDDYVVGTMRGDEFSVYEFYPSLVDAVDQVTRLVHQSPPCQQAPADVQERGKRTGRMIEYRHRKRGGKPGPNELEPGDCLDCFDTDRTHFLFALGTPMANRGQDLAVAQANPYCAYEVMAPLPMAVVEGIVAKTDSSSDSNYFGGGAMVVLDRPLRWYLDGGYLVQLR